jgi:hypothetical protein
MRPFAMLLFAILSMPSTAFAANVSDATVTDVDVEELARLFAGEFDSHDQAAMENKAQIPTADLHTEVYLIHNRWLCRSLGHMRSTSRNIAMEIPPK